ncbi:DUF4190 domain-containing protein [Streptomyces sp. NPDC054878]
MSHQMQYQQVPQGGAGFGLPAARNGLGTAALVLGIIGTVSGLPMITFWLAGPLGLLALIFGIVGTGRVKKGQATNKGVAVTGTVLGVISILLAATGLVLTLWVFNEAKDEIEKQTGNNVTEDLGAGEAAEYNNGLHVTVSKPSLYTVDPNTLVSGHSEGNEAYKVTITLENTGKDVFDNPLTTTKARSAGTELEEVNDDKHGLLHHNIGDSIAPGKSVNVEMVFDAPPSAKDLDITVTPDLLLDPATWKLSL